MTLIRGRVVLVTAGKEKGRLLVVCSGDNRVVLLADGKRRPLERPKQKNMRHITPTDHLLDEATLSSNRELRRALNKCRLTDK